MHPAFNESEICHIHGDMRGSTYAFEHCLTLPLYNDLSYDDQKYIVDNLLKFIN